MKLSALLAIALIGWLVLLGGVDVGRHVVGKAQHVAGQLHWSNITGVHYEPRRHAK
jgi:hypothetical protein